jgi:hypothetical protein
MRAAGQAEGLRYRRQREGSKLDSNGSLASQLLGPRLVNSDPTTAAGGIFDCGDKAFDRQACRAELRKMSAVGITQDGRANSGMAKLTFISEWQELLVHLEEWGTELRPRRLNARSARCVGALGNTELSCRVLELGNLCDVAVDYATSIRYYGDSSLIWSSPVKVFRFRICVFEQVVTRAFYGAFATNESENPVTVGMGCWVHCSDCVRSLVHRARLIKCEICHEAKRN